MGFLAGMGEAAGAAEGLGAAEAAGALGAAEGAGAAAGAGSAAAGGAAAGSEASLAGQAATDVASNAVPASGSTGALGTPEVPEAPKMLDSKGKPMAETSAGPKKGDNDWLKLAQGIHGQDVGSAQYNFNPQQVGQVSSGNTYQGLMEYLQGVGKR